MFGTVAIIKPKAGQEQAIVDKLNQWWDGRRKEIKGAVATTIHRNGAELILAVTFDNEANYKANAEDPAQDKWYQEVRALMDADPRWMDGEVLACKHA
jgi:hypothetical protein